MTKPSTITLLLLGSALILLLTLTLQYPLSTSFPIGGDAAFYVRVSRSLLDHSSLVEKLTMLKNAPYPLTYLTAASAVMLPLDWPERFTWLMTITYVVVGGCLGRLLYRLNGVAAAATGIAIWALVPIDITTHLEASTFAQLLSLVWLVLFFERLCALSWRGTILVFVMIVLTHPLTALVLALTVTAVVLAGAPIVRSLQPPEQRVYWVLASLTVLAGGAALLKLVSNPVFLTTGLQLEAADFPLADLAHSPLGPFLILAPLGFIQLVRHTRVHVLPKMTLVVFCIITLLLSFNHRLGVGLWTYRFQSYFVLGTIILSAMAFPWALRQVFTSRFLRVSFAYLLFGSLAVTTWYNNAHVFRYYEAPGNYARLHPAEYEGIQWMKNNLATTSVVITSNVNRHAEWIPALTNLQWLSTSQLNNEDKINDKLREARIFGRPVYLALFLNAEEIPAIFPGATTVFNNKDFVLLQVRK